jgi:hypothetical protein
MPHLKRDYLTSIGIGQQQRSIATDMPGLCPAARTSWLQGRLRRTKVVFTRTRVPPLQCANDRLLVPPAVAR